MHWMSLIFFSRQFNYCNMNQSQDQQSFPFNDSYSLNYYYNNDILQGFQQNYDHIPQKNRPTKQQENCFQPFNIQQCKPSVSLLQNKKNQRSFNIIQVSFKKLTKYAAQKKKKNSCLNFSRDLKIKACNFLNILTITNQNKPEDLIKIKEFQESNGTVKSFQKVFINKKIKRKFLQYLKSSSLIKQLLTSQNKEFKNKMSFLKDFQSADIFLNQEKSQIDQQKIQIYPNNFSQYESSSYNENSSYDELAREPEQL